MIKVSVLYPNGEGKTFDMDYYCSKHMPMVRERLGAACKGVAIEHGMAAIEPGKPPAFIAIIGVLFESVGEFQAAFGPHAGAIMSDIPNYTNIEPVMQISEVKS